MIPTAADLRAAIARRQVRLYELAPVVGIHPAHLGAALRERRVMTPDLATRIQNALDSMEHAAR